MPTPGTPEIRKFGPELNVIKDPRATPEQFRNNLYSFLFRLNDRSEVPSLSVTEIRLAPKVAGGFIVAHNLGVTPKFVAFEMNSSGVIYFQEKRYDASKLYLVASEANITGFAKLFS